MNQIKTVLQALLIPLLVAGTLSSCAHTQTAATAAETQASPEAAVVTENGCEVALERLIDAPRAGASHP